MWGHQMGTAEGKGSVCKGHGRSEAPGWMWGTVSFHVEIECRVLAAGWVDREWQHLHTHHSKEFGSTPESKVCHEKSHIGDRHHPTEL